MYIEPIKCTQINRQIDNRELSNRFIDKLDLCSQHFHGNSQLEGDYNEQMMHIVSSFSNQSAWGFHRN
ncbi:MAG: hypothetical protein KBD37_03215 [Burkholderiales bacterium]|nr:hypothetical protein [Burkholderiales bacterium]